MQECNDSSKTGYCLQDIIIQKKYWKIFYSSIYVSVFCKYNIHNECTAIFAKALFKVNVTWKRVKIRDSLCIHVSGFQRASGMTDCFLVHWNYDKTPTEKINMYYKKSSKHLCVVIINLPGVQFNSSSSIKGILLL